VTIFNLAACTQFSVPQIIANRDGYIPVVGGFEGGGRGDSRHETCGLQDGGLRECLPLGKWPLLSEMFRVNQLAFSTLNEDSTCESEEVPVHAMMTCRRECS